MAEILGICYLHTYVCELKYRYASLIKWFLIGLRITISNHAYKTIHVKTDIKITEKKTIMFELD